MSSTLEPQYAIVVEQRLKDGTEFNLRFQRASDHYEYLSMQQEVRDGMMSMFGDISKDKGELN